MLCVSPLQTTVALLYLNIPTWKVLFLCSGICYFTKLFTHFTSIWVFQPVCILAKCLISVTSLKSVIIRLLTKVWNRKRRKKNILNILIRVSFSWQRCVLLSSWYCSYIYRCCSVTTITQSCVRVFLLSSISIWLCSITALLTSSIQTLAQMHRRYQSSPVCSHNTCPLFNH